MAEMKDHGGLNSAESLEARSTINGHDSIQDATQISTKKKLQTISQHQLKQGVQMFNKSSSQPVAVSLNTARRLLRNAQIKDPNQNKVRSNQAVQQKISRQFKQAISRGEKFRSVENMALEESKSIRGIEEQQRQVSSQQSSYLLHIQQRHNRQTQQDSQAATLQQKPTQTTTYQVKTGPRVNRTIEKRYSLNVEQEVDATDAIGSERPLAHGESKKKADHRTTVTAKEETKGMSSTQTASQTNILAEERQGIVPKPSDTLVLKQNPEVQSKQVQQSNKPPSNKYRQSTTLRLETDDGLNGIFETPKNMRERYQRQKMVVDKVQKRSDQLSVARNPSDPVDKSQQALQSLMAHNGRSTNNL